MTSAYSALPSGEYSLMWLHRPKYEGLKGCIYLRATTERIESPVTSKMHRSKPLQCSHACQGRGQNPFGIEQEGCILGMCLLGSLYYRGFCPGGGRFDREFLSFFCRELCRPHVIQLLGGCFCSCWECWPLGFVLVGVLSRRLIKVSTGGGFVRPPTEQPIYF